MTTLTGAGRIAGWLVTTTLCAGSGAAFAREKTDIVELRNGDRVTCEIKNLERGRLKVSTDSMGTLYIEWKDIVRVTSNELYVVELQDGRRLDGTLAEPQVKDALRLQSEAGEQAIDMHRVVWLDPLKLDAMAIKRWDGSVSAGFDMTKANSDKSLSASFSARRRAESYVLNFDGAMYSRSQDGVEDSTRANLTGAYRRLLEDRWYWAALGGFERNDELGIDLRSLGGGGFGRYLIQSGRSLWSVTGGLAVVNEQRAEEEAETNVESFFNTDYEFFTFDTPKTTLTTALTIYPSLTDSGRVRSNLDFSIRQELITDLFLELTFYDSYDSKPPGDGTKNDYGVVTGLGYTF